MKTVCIFSVVAVLLISVTTATFDYETPRCTMKIVVTSWIDCRNVGRGDKTLDELLRFPMDLIDRNGSVIGTSDNASFVTTMTIEGNNYTVGESVLRRFHNLQYLDMTGYDDTRYPGQAQHSTVHPNAFIGLTKLYSLDLNGFDLTDDTLKSLRPFYNTVQSLTIWFCPTEQFPAQLREFTNLKEIKIGRCLIDISANAFEKSSSTLERVFLWHNNISKIRADMFSNLFNMTMIHLDHSNVREIEEGAFDGSPALNYVNLEGNRLEHLPPDFLKRNQEIDTLKLLGNPLRNVTRETFHYLPELRYFVPPRYD